MKSVLISIQPKWCELIASGKKTVEVRKTKPKLETPFKCYIYCTVDKRLLRKFDKGERIDDEHFFDEHVFVRQNTWIRGHFNPNKKVIGEFVCDRIINIPYIMPFDIEDTSHPMRIDFIHETCVPDWELDEYLGRKDGYGWHISDLVIYDKPKELSEFEPLTCDYNADNECIYRGECKHQETTMCWGYITKRCNKQITRPPQSWCYVEQLKGE